MHFSFLHLAGILSLGCFFGSIFAGYVMEKIGRKKTLLVVTSSCFLIGYLAIFLANDVIIIYIGRYPIAPYWHLVSCRATVAGAYALRLVKSRYVTYNIQSYFVIWEKNNYSTLNFFMRLAPGNHFDSWDVFDTTQVEISQSRKCCCKIGNTQDITRHNVTNIT